MSRLPAVCALLVCLAPGAPGAQGSVAAYKCTAPDGHVSYQQTPCPKQQQSEQLQLEGEVDASRKAQADAIAQANQPDPPPPRSAVVPAPAVAAPPRERVVCPATRENPGPIPVIGTDPWSMAIARDYYRQLPSRTWLKNTGRLPKECE